MSTRTEHLEDLPVQMLECRDAGHVWHHVHDDVTRGVGEQVISYSQNWTCRCGTSKRRTIEVPSFRVVSTRYSYADGYLLAPGASAGGPLRVAVRQLTFGRILAGLS